MLFAYHQSVGTDPGGYVGLPCRLMRPMVYPLKTPLFAASTLESEATGTP